MFQLILVLFTFAGVFCAPSPLDVATIDVDGRIVGGQDTTIEQHPYQISLLLLGSHRCGGSIISDRWIVTAAHCMGFPLSWFSVRAGSSIRNAGGVTIAVSAEFIHPNYNEGAVLNNDICILELASALTFSDSIAPISLPSDGQEFADGTDSVVTGWGTLSFQGSAATQLQEVTVPIVNQAECDLLYTNHELSVTDTMICAGFVGEGGRDACQGDSGGPLVVGDLLVGVVSWGEECALADYPGVYASVPALRAFIRLITGM